MTLHSLSKKLNTQRIRQKSSKNFPNCFLKNVSQLFFKNVFLLFLKNISQMFLRNISQPFLKMSLSGSSDMFLNCSSKTFLDSSSKIFLNYSSKMFLNYSSKMFLISSWKMFLNCSSKYPKIPNMFMTLFNSKTATTDHNNLHLVASCRLLPLKKLQAVSVSVTLKIENCTVDLLKGLLTILVKDRLHKKTSFVINKIDNFRAKRLLVNFKQFFCYLFKLISFLLGQFSAVKKVFHRQRSFIKYEGIFICFKTSRKFFWFTQHFQRYDWF